MSLFTDQTLSGYWVYNGSGGVFTNGDSIGLSYPDYTDEGINLNFFEDLKKLNWKDGNEFFIPSYIQFTSDGIVAKNKVGLHMSTDMINTSNYELELNEPIALAPHLTRRQEFRVRTSRNETEHIFPLTVPLNRYTMELDQLDEHLSLYYTLENLQLDDDRKNRYRKKIISKAIDDMASINSESNSGNKLWNDVLEQTGSPENAFKALEQIYSISDTNIISKLKELNETVNFYSELGILFDETKWTEFNVTERVPEVLKQLQELCNSSFNRYQMCTQAVIKESLENWKEPFSIPRIARCGRCTVYICCK